MVYIYISKSMVYELMMLYPITHMCNRYQIVLVCMYCIVL